MIDQTFCTLVTVGRKFLEKKTFRKVLQKIDEIRKIIWMWIIILFPFLNIYHIKDIELEKTHSNNLPSDHLNRIPLAVFLMDADGGCICFRIISFSLILFRPKTV